MCRRVNCPTCSKPDWRGCGAHIDQVLGDVPKKDRCGCSAEEKKSTSFLGRFFGL